MHAEAQQRSLDKGFARKESGTGTFFLLLFNVAVFVAYNLLHLPWANLLPLSGRHPEWWQYLTSAFCHADW